MQSDDGGYCGIGPEWRAFVDAVNAEIRKHRDPVPAFNESVEVVRVPLRTLRIPLLIEGVASFDSSAGA